ncbi:MAG: hypothetical protein N7Q72_02095 [Spiroplasma sp. Tabriz.8]|nr:hypothetical protein [Candidatus Karelsulcia muelleri]MCZ8632035.1 hypothetical protein [Spiroplasma sp. Tabriz.8]
MVHHADEVCRLRHWLNKSLIFCQRQSYIYIYIYIYNITTKFFKIYLK